MDYYHAGPKLLSGDANVCRAAADALWVTSDSLHFVTQLTIIGYADNVVGLVLRTAKSPWMGFCNMYIEWHIL